MNHLLKPAWLAAILFSGFYSLSQQKENYSAQIDSLLLSSTSKPFNGIVLIARDGQTMYSKVRGYSDLDEKKLLQSNSEFVIGSISKQFTAVLVLQEYEKGRLALHQPIRTYLPELTQGWADTVTVHHLLTHMHGITALDKPSAFKAGTRFDYSNSNIGYSLLAKITEKTSGKSFAVQSAALFKKCSMKNTFHPDIKEYINLVKGFTEKEDGRLDYEKASFENAPAAGGFISTASDLIVWNQNLHGGKLLKTSTLIMMTTKQKDAIRQHPLFGVTEYGYGITVNTKDNILQLGQTGFAPGFASMNFYFPATKTSVVVLSNVAYATDDLTKTFSYHVQILKTVRESDWIATTLKRD